MWWVSASRPLWLPPNIHCSSYMYILSALAPKKWHQVSSSPKSLGEMQLLWSGPQHVARRGADLQLKKQVYLPLTQDLMYKGRKEPGACMFCAWVSTKILPRWSLNGAFWLSCWSLGLCLVPSPHLHSYRLEAIRSSIFNSISARPQSPIWTPAKAAAGPLGTLSTAAGFPKLAGL